ncbi:helix-turn-helix domain-containing protein [Acidobacteriota bacterium]
MMDEFITLRELALLIRRSPGTLRNWISAGKCPLRMLKVKGRWMVPKGEVKNFLRESVTSKTTGRGRNPKKKNRPTTPENAM